MAGGFGVLFNKNPLALSLPDQISFAAQHSWGYGYWGPFLLDLEVSLQLLTLLHLPTQDSDPGCGLDELNRVLYDYSFVTSLHQTYGPGQGQGGYGSGLADDRPEVGRRQTLRLLYTS